ncbi:FK506-binding protein-like isoform 1-T4 [Spinachia spinachia]
MDRGHLFETLHGDDVPSTVCVCPRGLWKVQQKQSREWSQQTVSTSGDGASCSSSNFPRLGSLCQVRVRLKANPDEAESLVSEKGNECVTETEATAFPRCQDSVLQVPMGDWITLRLGEGRCDITEACVEGMRAGEKCEIMMSPSDNGPDVSVPDPAEEKLPLWATVELKAFTPGKESWAMSPVEKCQWVKSHKESGGERFKSGDVWGAADSYSRALKILITLHGYAQEVGKKGQEQGAEEQRDTNTSDETQQLPSANEFKTIKAELHSNMSLCQLKLNQPQRAKASATKATNLEPGGAKAWYRMGQACQLLNELQEARQAFMKLLELQPESPSGLKALKGIAGREKEKNAQLGLRLSKMFS